MESKYLIILLNYNNWQDTLDCIESLENTGVECSKILVIENCSANDSFEKLNTKALGIKIIRTDRNLGFSGGNNVGVKYAYENNYDYAIVLNNDTIVEDKDTIKLLVSEMDENPGVTIGTGRIFYYPEKNKIWYDGGRIIKWRASEEHFNFRCDINETKIDNEKKYVDFISGCLMCIRLKDLSVLGYMDENFFMYLDDIEYCFRATKKNLKLLYIPEVVIYHKSRGEGSNTPRRVYYSIKNRKLVINMYFGIITKLYFIIVLIVKRILWFFTNKKYFRILNYAVKDYKKKYFGPAPDFIK